MRYGCIPLVRATGGLRDSVVPLAGDRGTGFVFEPANSGALASAMRQAISVHGNPLAWRALQLRAMAQDFGWDRSASAYRDFYHRMTSVQ
jgi:starch synthase